jgi:hypothetical protein
MSYYPDSGGPMAKKTIVEKFREFMEASSDQSNKPMTKAEIATAVKKRKRKAATKKRSAKSSKKKATPKKKGKKSKRG